MRIPFVALAITVLPTVAAAEGRIEAGFTVGAHAFSDNSELGVEDLMDGASPQSSALLGGRLSYALIEQVVGEVELVLVPTVDDRASGATAIFGFRGQVRYEPFQSSLMQGKLHPFLLAGYGAIALRTDSAELKNDVDQSYEWGLGARYLLSQKLALRFDGRHLIIPDRTKNGATSNFEISAGLSWHFGAPRRAPMLQERVVGAPGLVTTATGKPPTESKAVSVAPTAPPPKPPQAAAEAAPSEPDADKDGVLYPQDQCLKEAEDRDGFRDEDGCPDADNDDDRLADGNDKCPLDAETINGYADADGCPDAIHPDMAPVAFARGSVGFTAETAAALEKTFQILQQTAQLRVEISGHSSSDESNKTLSLRRAEAVKQYLVTRGIAEARMRVLGYRDERPLSTDRAGRAKNRRVELRLLPLE